MAEIGSRLLHICDRSPDVRSYSLIPEQHSCRATTVLNAGDNIIDIRNCGSNFVQCPPELRPNLFQRCVRILEYHHTPIEQLRNVQRLLYRKRGQRRSGEGRWTAWANEQKSSADHS